LDEMNDRTCIVTRNSAEPDDLIRFVVGPDSTVVPDIKRTLPGRGCWVTADRATVDKAVSKAHFPRAFKRQVAVPPDLGANVDLLLARAALGALGLARKAGQLALGAAKVDGAVRSGKALLVLHAAEGSEDGVRKIAQARRATVHLGGPAIPAYKLFSEAELSLALGGTNVIHAAVLASDAGKAAQKRIIALDRYRGGSPDDLAMLAAVAGQDDAAEDVE
jgi:uncharacterized protein